MFFMKTTFKKALSLVMILMMVVSTMVILPLTANAETASTKPSGSGTPTDPYLVSSPANLVWIGS